jgi:putative pyruvate formate lyase activating enzyme
VSQSDIYDKYDRLILEQCTLCPRECRVNRFAGGSGYCGSDAGLNIASICIHNGEEPPVSGPKGICNIFFSGCNLHCVFCQNHEISHSKSVVISKYFNLDGVLDKIEEILSEGLYSVGFVSPSHMVPQMKAIISGLNSRGLNPVIIYNTNSYDKPETLRSLAGMVDVYLPDYKYVTPRMAREFSDADDYPDVALRALKEMYYQKGSRLDLDDNGAAERGLLIRHLVLPGYEEESKNVLRSIASELSTGVNISLMSQYNPAGLAKKHPLLGRSVYKAEYESVMETMNELGFRNGWIQDLDSSKSYSPDFSREHPFE